MDMDTLLYLKWVTRTYWTAQGTLLNAMRQPGWEGTWGDYGFTVNDDGSHEIKRHLLTGRKAMTKPDSILKSRDITANRGLHSQSYGFSSSQIWMWELDHKEGWAPKNWCFLTVVLEKTLERPLDCKEIKSINPNGNQPRIFIGRTDAEVLIP